MNDKKKILNAILKICKKYPKLANKILVIIDVDPESAAKVIRLLTHKLKIRKIHEERIENIRIIHFA